MRGLVQVPPVRVSWIGLPVSSSAFSMAATEASGCSERSAAQAPVTCGADIDVPLDRPNWLLRTDERIAAPGANTSTRSPTFEKLTTTSLLVVALTAMAFEMQAGNETPFLLPSLPD